ncbi:FHA domain-containing protein [Clostridium sartagoforme]|uniref:FHA domain-containing protein n=1 Tax=Clostridium sartagoforme TaxID=84031 RepID=A0A4S2DER1_9CLOT|nr:FHA domain-containing protein [Clostridium sartagoforme]TGY39932.1 FHA domain-containing protein [Clostridium sartagoforme]
MKFKAKVKNSELTVKVKISSNEVISEREIDILENKKIRGLLKPKQRRKNLIDYSGPAGVSLIEHLKKPITRYEFFFIMAQIVDATKKVENNNLFLNNLILDLRYVYINENTKEMQFIYIPVLSNHILLNIIGFMEAIAYAVKLMPNQDFDFVAKYVSFIRSLNHFNISSIEAYISKEDKDVAKQIKNQKVNVDGFIIDKPKDYYEDKMEYCNEETSILESDEETGLLNEYGSTGILDSYEKESMEVLHDNEGTMLLDANEKFNIGSYQENVHFPYLVRTSNSEIISINKPVFRLGKERSYVDYFVTNNNAVSRSHADIITRGKSYFVCDQNSTNHTYINDKVLVIKAETEIHEGDVLKLANEEFTFHI